MAFIDTRFPVDIMPGVVGGPTFNTNVTVTGSGVEQRISQWSSPRYKWDVQYGLKTPAQMAIAIAFFNSMQGRLDSFRFKDWSDHTDAGSGIFVDVTTGAQTYSGTGPMQMYKNYTTGGQTTPRKITKPVASTVTVYDNGTLMVSGTDYTLDLTMGSITFTSPSGLTGHTITWIGQFDVHCRFDTDELKFTQDASTVSSWNEIPILEIRD